MPLVPALRDPSVPDHDAEDSAGVRGIAVGVLAGAGRDSQSLLEISFPVEQAQRDVGAVQFGVNVESPEGAVGARFALVPLVGDQLPRLHPIVRIVGVPLQHVTDQQRVRALGGQAVRPGFDDLAGVVLEEGRRVHARNEHAAVDSIPVVHHATARQASSFAATGMPGVIRPTKSASI